MKVKCNVLDRQFFQYQQEYEEAALRVLRSGWYVLGNEVKQFEEEFAAFTGRKYCVGLNSGLDALIMSVSAFPTHASHESFHNRTVTEIQTLARRNT